MRSRLAVILVADVVGYTRLMAEDEARAIAAVTSLRDSHLEPRVETHGGEVLKRLGDGWILAFGSVTAAVKCARDVQEALAADPSLTLRIGGHLGEIVEDESDFYGAGVNLAQRLQNEAPPGGIMVSQDLVRQMTGDLAHGFEDAGSFELKNIPFPVQAYQWRPAPANRKQAPDSVPKIAIGQIDCAPDTADAQAAAQDLHDQIVLLVSRRTGVQVVDEKADPDYLVRGRLRLAGTRGRLTLSLLVGAEERTAFSRNYEGDTSDPFAFCDEIAGLAASDLRMQTSRLDADRAAQMPLEQMSVSELRARAVGHIYQASVEGFMDARNVIERALELSPRDPVSLAMRAGATQWLQAAGYADVSDEEWEAFAEDVAIALDGAPNSDFVLHTMSVIKIVHDRDAAAAKHFAERSLAISPKYMLGQMSLAWAHLLGGEMEAGIEVLKRVAEQLENDPFQVKILFQLAAAQYCHGDYAQALETIDRVITVKPRNPPYHRFRALCFEAMGDEAGAARAREAARNARSDQMEHCVLPPLPGPFAELQAKIGPSRQSRMSQVRGQVIDLPPREAV
ncbi:adenylate/guanylate cyclase domain-containing protein [Chachezhania sediminis]|uniref:adenylate/guanylate cyclase domain-containing protein n=1 Tax=Chachezhania sediminis TaxID=2599291 RepID=UPI00131AAFD6|nr:adenylate/guanylate cyclase domain-containing protein [Chachezhania sediminis]